MAQREPSRVAVPPAGPESPEPGRAAFLDALFRHLENSGVRYCVLHSYEGLPTELVSDLDLAVHPDDLPKLQSVFQLLEKESYRPIQRINYAVGANYFVFAWFEGLTLGTQAVDIISEHRRGGLILASGAELVAGRRRKGVFWRADAGTEFSYLLAKKTFKGAISRGQEERLQALVAELGVARAERIAACLFGRAWAGRVLAACAAGCAASVLPALRSPAWRTAVTRNLPKALWCWIEEAARLLWRWLHPTGLFLIVLGPDGAGKSTLLENLLPQVRGAFRRTRRFHWRPGLLWRRQATGPVAHPHAQAESSPYWSAARVIGHLLDYWLGYWLAVRPMLARSGLVVFDRYFDDLLADPRRYRYHGPLWLVRLLSRVRPKPQLVLVLGAPEEVILSRKQEVTPEAVRRQRLAYDELADRLGAERIDAAAPAAAVTAVAARVITEYLALRFRGRLSEWRRSPGQRTIQAALSRFLAQGDPVARCSPGALGAPAVVWSRGNCDRSDPPGALGRCFAVLPSRRAPRWLLPLGDTCTTLRGLEVYAPYTRRARFLKRLLAAWIKTGRNGWARDRLLVASAAPLPLEMLIREITGERRPVCALSLGSAAGCQKLTIEVMRPTGEVLGYIKLPLMDEANARLRHEAAFLQSLWNLVALRPHIPRVLYAGEWQGGYILFQAPGRGQPGSAKFTPLHQQFLETLWAVSPLEKSGYVLVEEVAARWQAAASVLDSEWQRLGAAALKLALRKLNGTVIPCGLAHGDFAPWNTRVDPDTGRLFVFDWESASPSTPNLWDSFHFHVQVASLLRRPLNLGGNGADPPSQSALLLLYMLSSVSDLIQEGAETGDRGIKYRKKLITSLLERRGWTPSQ